MYSYDDQIRATELCIKLGKRVGYIIAGPVFTPTSTAMGANQLRGPTHFFKLAYDATTQRI